MRSIYTIGFIFVVIFSGLVLAGANSLAPD
jgi:hypothetical protein